MIITIIISTRRIIDRAEQALQPGADVALGVLLPRGVAGRKLVEKMVVSDCT